MIGMAAQPAEARGHWHWNGATYVWIETPYYAPAYYPPYPAYYYPDYGYGYYGYGYPYYYGPSVGLSFRIH